MYQIDLKKPERVHFIGIGGISMSGFAELLFTSGFSVSGSDQNESNITKHLEQLGIKILYGQRAKNITEDLSLVVYTAAVKPDNPEFRKAKELGIPMMERAVMVGQIMKNYKNAIAVSGTHGKTTTTSMISQIFLAAGTDPTISVGGILKAIDGNLRIGQSDLFITEACEYTNSFLHFHPSIGIILNIEEDHLDFFKDLDDIRNSFHRFAALLPPDGTLIINGDIEDYQAITNDLECHIATYGLNNKNVDFTADDITMDENGCVSFRLIHHGQKKGNYTLCVPGIHNVSNALASIALAFLFSITPEQIQSGLTEFHGADRRFEYKGERNGFRIYDDYAHHPTEIQSTLSSAANLSYRKLYVAFQPHTFTRTRAFLTDFAEALSLADEVILADIYAAREKDPGDISSQNLQQEILKRGTPCHYFSPFEDIEKFVLKNLVNGDLLITMGAGNIVEIGENLLAGNQK